MARMPTYRREAVWDTETGRARPRGDLSSLNALRAREREFCGVAAAPGRPTPTNPGGRRSLRRACSGRQRRSAPEHPFA